MSDFEWKYLFGDENNFKKRGDFKTPREYIDYIESSDWERDHNRSHMSGYASILDDAIDRFVGLHERYGDTYQNAVKENAGLTAYSTINNTLKRRINKDKSIDHDWIGMASPKRVKELLDAIQNNPYPLDIYNGLVDRNAGETLIKDALSKGFPLHTDEDLR